MKILLFLLTLLSISLIASCGKSPLQLKKSNDEVQANNGLSISKKFTSTGHSIDLVWLSPRNSTDVAHFLMIAKQNNLASDLPLDFSLFLWMPSMGHGSSPVTLKKIATGVYDISDVYFIMDGDWQIRVQLKNASTIIEEMDFEYTI